MNIGDFPHYIGCSYILPVNLSDSVGVLSLPITSQKHVPIGQLTAHYLVVKPMKNVDCSLEVSYARYWKKNWKGIEVGHRGAGNSYHMHTNNCANIRENTIASLIYAAENGADMVEFDVQLSKDLVPVIYHDLHVLITLKKRKEPLESDLMMVPIKDLTLDQLQALKTYHKTERGQSRFNDDDDNEDLQPFPTLERTMECVPESCGFNIEIKSVFKRSDGTLDLKDPFEVNKFVDIILKAVLNSKTRRKIVFSCFDPNICTMLRVKQNKFPVLFLIDEWKPERNPYEDIRTRSLNAAIYFATSVRILGINPNSTLILSNTKGLKSAFEHKLVIFSWGDGNADRAVVDTLIDLGLHGIIYDKIDVHNTKSKKGNIFLCDEHDDANCMLFSNSVHNPSMIISSYSVPPQGDIAEQENPTNFSGILEKVACNNIRIST